MIKTAVISIVLGCVLLLIVEHMGSFSYRFNHTYGGKEAGIASITYITPFNAEVINYHPGHFQMKDTFDKESELHTYTFQFPYYLNGFLKDFYIAIAAALLFFIVIKRRIK